MQSRRVRHRRSHRKAHFDPGVSTGARIARARIFDHPVIRDLQCQVDSLQQQLTAARAEAAALRVARDVAIRLSVWGGRRVEIASRYDEK